MPRHRMSLRDLSMKRRQKHHRAGMKMKREECLLLMTWLKRMMPVITVTCRDRICQPIIYHLWKMKEARRVKVLRDRMIRMATERGIMYRQMIYRIM